MTVTLAIALVLASGAAARRTSGTVRYAIAGRLYLDAGARDGLAPEQTIELKRDDVSPYSAEVRDGRRKLVAHVRDVRRGRRTGDRVDLGPAERPRRQNRPWPAITLCSASISTGTLKPKLLMLLAICST